MLRHNGEIELEDSTGAATIELSGGVLQTTELYAYTVVFEIDANDLIALKDEVAVGNTIDDTFMTAGAGMINDWLNQPMLAATTSVVAESVSSDGTGPSITSFVFDLNEGTLIVTFSEPVIEVKPERMWISPSETATSDRVGILRSRLQPKVTRWISKMITLIRIPTTRQYVP